MLDIQTFNRALKSIWIPKYLDDNNTGKWKLIFDFYLSKQGGKHLFSGNPATKDFKNLGLGIQLLNEILYIWAEINFQQTLCDFQNSPLWHNSLSRVANPPVFFEKWSNKSINRIKDLPFQCTKDTNLQSFQFKLLHRRIATNDFLNKIGVSSSAMCTFCNEYVETLEHVFWECRFSQSFWKNVMEWVKELKTITRSTPLNAYMTRTNSPALQY